MPLRWSGSPAVESAISAIRTMFDAADLRRYFQNLSLAVRALSWTLENVIRHTGIRSGNASENIVERNLRVPGVALLA
jgi:hypothetical protein